MAVFCFLLLKKKNRRGDDRFVDPKILYKIFTPKYFFDLILANSHVKQLLLCFNILQDMSYRFSFLNFNIK